jgi:2-hydroxychromene-2-carboxylate isomerase
MQKNKPQLKVNNMKFIWYFDFISPFAYMQHCLFNQLPDDVEIEYRPILFAGLLKHWENVGPAEIAPKRIFTYKHCYWQAKRRNIAFKMPPEHPFNSLAALRLAIALNCQKDVIQIIFEAIWKEGLSLHSPEAIHYLEAELEISDLVSLISEQSVKDQLRTNTEKAIFDSVFGVPTFITTSDEPMLNNELFWGLDSFEMLLDYLKCPSTYNDLEMQRIAQLPEGIQRKR